MTSAAPAAPSTCAAPVWPLFGHGPATVCGSPVRAAFPGHSDAYVTCTRSGHVTTIARKA
jgi:hypothetical protein